MTALAGLPKNWLYSQMVVSRAIRELAGYTCH